MSNSPSRWKHNEMNTKLLLFFVLLVFAQVMSWYQSNSMIMWDSIKKYSVPIIIFTSPFIGLLFAYGTKVGYEVLESLWAIRFSAFAVGYLVFIVLAWVHFEESPFTLKNLITTVLCFALIGIQMFWKSN